MPPKKRRYNKYTPTIAQQHRTAVEVVAQRGGWWHNIDCGPAVKVVKQEASCNNEHDTKQQPPNKRTSRSCRVAKERGEDNETSRQVEDKYDKNREYLKWRRGR
jgi:hypothetical protein